MKSNEVRESNEYKLEMHSVSSMTMFLQMVNSQEDSPLEIF